MPRKNEGWITFQLPEAERQVLAIYCEQTQRSKTDVLRELVRTLNPVSHNLQASNVRDNIEIRPMRVSARNVFPATIKQVSLGSVNAEILLEIAPSVIAVSVITRSSAESLQLEIGQQAYAMIKSSDVMVAIDN